MQLPTSKQPSTPAQPPKGRLPHQNWWWWLIMIALLAWNVWTFRPSSNPQVNLPYSAFLDQVRAGNVPSVEIAGDQITGQFVHPIAWPQNLASPTPAATAATAATAAPAPSTPATTYSAFISLFPATVGDTSLLPLLEENHVVVNTAPPATPWLSLLLTYGLPVLLFVGVMVWLGRSAARSQAGIFGFGRTKARRYAAEGPKVTFDDVAGADEAKSDLKEVVDFLRHPMKYHDLGARIPRGVLLVGSPGTGKTLMARAVAGEADVPFFSLSASEFVEMFVGVGASRVRDLFKQAKAAAPAIIFIDELDAVGRRRGAGVGNTNDEREQTLNQLLVEMDGFDDRHEVIMLAATNRPDVLDPALLRPGRFDRRVTVELPDRPGREAILRLHSRGLHLAPDVELNILARTTTGMSGADLANLCNEAALVAAHHDHGQIDMSDFEEALDKVLLGNVRPVLLDAHERQVVAYHEGGHALVAWLNPAADPVHKITIIPHGRALGVTEQLPGDDRYNYDHTYLVARLDVMLGGRVAEEIAMGDITTGAENDLVHATQLARRMIARWGMGSLGPVAYQADEEQPFLGYALAQGRDYSEATAARIDDDLQRLLEQRQEAVRGVLTGARDQLDRLAHALLQDETIDRAELVRVLGPRPEADSAMPPHGSDRRVAPGAVAGSAVGEPARVYGLNAAALKEDET